MIEDKPTDVVSRKTGLNTAVASEHIDQFISQVKAIPLPVWQWLVVAITVVWLAITAARAFWLLMPSPNVPPAIVGVIADSVGGSAQTADIGKLKAIEPFGRAAPVKPLPTPAERTASQADLDSAADTSLNLVLRGVVASSDPKKARALIAKGDRQANYSIGDKMPEGNNVTLEKILPSRVILKNNGKFESLWLYKDDKTRSLGTANPRVDPRPAAEPSRPSANAEASPFARQEMDPEVAEAVAADPSMAQVGATLTDIVAMSIHRENGQVVGYKIRPGRNVDMFNSFGLKTDDVVTAVNGMPLNNPGQIMEIYRNLNGATSVSLEIRRGDGTVTVDINL